MRRLDEATLLRAGGWDTRYARVLAVANTDRCAAALIDTNGDGTEVDIDEYRRAPDGRWTPSSSGSAGAEGSSWSAGMTMAWGQCVPEERVQVSWGGTTHTVHGSVAGIWLFVADTSENFDPDLRDSMPTRIQGAQRQDRGAARSLPLTARSKRWQRRVWRWPVVTPPTAPPKEPPTFE